MRLLVYRTQGDGQCTLGEMTSENGTHLCYTMEPRRDQSQGKPFCISAGTFTIKLSWSCHFQKIVPVLQNVPGFTAVEIHPGNYPKDTHACTLVGDMKGIDFIGQSDKAFDLLMGILSSVSTNEAIIITYVDPN